MSSSQSFSLPPTARRARKKSRSARRPEEPEAALLAQFRQAEICCEEARSAARLKRFEAACGLFSTAQLLLQRIAETGGEWRAEACERLRSVSCEMAAHRELARSVSRPLGKKRRLSKKS